jgi:hypothetical protein
MSSDFVGFLIDPNFTSVLQVDTGDYGKAPEGPPMPFSYFEG